MGPIVIEAVKSGIEEALPLLGANFAFFVLFYASYILTKQSKLPLFRIVLNCFIVVLFGVLYKFTFEGVHFEPSANWDPIYGGTDEVWEYDPTLAQRITAASKLCVLLILPLVLGVYYGRRDNFRW